MMNTETCTSTTTVAARGAAYSGSLYEEEDWDFYNLDGEAAEVLHALSPCASWWPKTSEVVACTRHAAHVAEQLAQLVQPRDLRPFLDQIQDQA
jgi:hypothetical protein